VDAITTFGRHSAEAWTYQLGNRSALEWVLDQWKETQISDPPWLEIQHLRVADGTKKGH